jgi:azurin
MSATQRIVVVALLLGASVAHADPCKLTIESNDLMQFSVGELAVPPECSRVELTLRNVGKLPVRVMGHDWVLARDTDMPAIVNAGLAAGPAHGFVPENDARVIAATHLVGGGESATVEFSTAALVPGGRYSFFCSSPGHSAVMRGRFLFGEPGRLAQAGKPGTRPQ